MEFGLFRHIFLSLFERSSPCFRIQMIVHRCRCIHLLSGWSLTFQQHPFNCLRSSRIYILDSLQQCVGTVQLDQPPTVRDEYIDIDELSLGLESLLSKGLSIGLIKKRSGIYGVFITISLSAKLPLMDIWMFFDSFMIGVMIRNVLQ